MIVLWIGVALIFALLYLKQLRAVYVHFWSQGLRGPNSLWPIVGAAHLIPKIRRNPFQLWEELQRQYGKTFGFYVPLLFVNRAFVHTNDARNVRWMLGKGFDNYKKGGDQRRMAQEMLGTSGIFTVDPPIWHPLRKTISLFFTAKTLRYCHDVFAEHAAAVTARLAAARRAGRTVELEDLFGRFTLDCITHVAFGIDAGAVAADAPPPFAAAFDAANAAVATRVYTPLFYARPWLESERRLRRAMVVVDDFVYRIIETRLEEVERGGGGGGGGGGERGDMLSFFLSAGGGGNDELAKALGEDFGDANGGASDGATAAAAAAVDWREPRRRQWLRDQILSVLIAGRDTTSILIAWAAWHLSAEPAMRAALAAELDEVVGDAGEEDAATTALPSYEQARQLTLMRACLHETLRLHPPVFKNFKVCRKDDVWPDGTRVYRGTWCSYRSIVLGQDESRFRDAPQWRPRRWLDAAANGGEVARADDFIPFHYGPRTCLGERFALIEASIMLCTMIRARIGFEPDDALPPPQLLNSITLKSTGIHVKVKQCSWKETSY